MSRPSNPQPQFAARPLPGHLAADQDAQAWNAAQGRAPHQPQQAPQGYAQQYAYQPEVPPGPYAQQAAPPPDPFAGTPYAAPQAAPQPRQAPAYAPPQHDPYAAAQTAQPQAYGGAPAYGGQPQWPAGAQDQGGYDLSSYAAAAPSLGGYGQAPQHRAGQWGGADPYAAEPAFEPPMYAAQPQHGGTVEQTYAEEDAAYEMEPPQGRSRKLAMVLLGAVIVGGGLTYAYSALLGRSPDGATPVVKGAEGPFKVKPSDPGGKQFAHTDSKIMGRLGDGGEAAPSNDADTSGARKVPVLTVGRDGSIQAPAASEEPSPQRATVSVPGMLVSGLGGPPPSPPARAETADAKSASETKPEPASAKIKTAAVESQEPVVVTPPAAPKKPEAAASSTAEPAGSASSSLSTAAIAAAPGEESKKAAPAPKKTAAVAPPAAPVAATPAPTGAGWVAVLLSVPASGKSRMDALKQFADMQQKYGPLLQNKTPDIQEANLGEKGTYHRLMVGPPGSREVASELCTQLKAQGYPSCWVTAY